MKDLAVLESCDGCGGACCSEMAAPGEYVTLLQRPDWQLDDDPDAVRLREMPSEARREIEDYLERGETEGFPFRTPCFWLDKSGRCRWYEWRPQVCRDFQLGDWMCHYWRRKTGVE